MGVLRASSLLALLLLVPLEAQSGAEILVRIDKLRHPWPSFSLEVELQLEKAAQRWKVLSRKGGDARVEGLSAKEKGRVVLILGDQMWLLLPTAKKPVKVTPQQRLLGSAAGGDLARSTMADDYDVKSQAEGELEGKPCLVLDLQAKRSSLSYRTARLWVDRTATRPLKAEYCLASGKLARTVRFPAPKMEQGLPVLPGMSIEEPGGKRVELRFSAWMPGAHDTRLFEIPPAK